MMKMVILSGSKTGSIRISILTISSSRGLRETQVSSLSAPWVMELRLLTTDILFKLVWRGKVSFTLYMAMVDAHIIMPI